VLASKLHWRLQQAGRRDSYLPIEPFLKRNGVQCPRITGTWGPSATGREKKRRGNRSGGAEIIREQSKSHQQSQSPVGNLGFEPRAAEKSRENNGPKSRLTASQSAPVAAGPKAPGAAQVSRFIWPEIIEDGARKKALKI
jgi:hypothetical protein